MSSTLIERALASTTVLSTDEDRAEAITVERDRLCSLRANLLPFEAAAKEDLGERIKLADAELAAIKTAKAVDNLPMLDNQVFSWTKRQVGWKKTFGVQVLDVPALAFISIQKSELHLAVDGMGDTWVNHEWSSSSSGLPREIDSAYRKTMKKMRGYLGRERLRLTYTYPGVVPQEIRDTIQAEYTTPSGSYSKPVLRRFDSLAFICEVDRWDTQKIELPRQHLDPILVGVKNGACFVLGSFDPTTLENYISSEFTS